MKRYPWRKFWLDKRDEGRKESEDGIWEERDSSGDAVEEIDTDEEIKRIKLKDRKEKNMQRNNNDTVTSSSILGPYEYDTDEEIEKIKMEEMKDKKKTHGNEYMRKRVYTPVT